MAAFAKKRASRKTVYGVAGLLAAAALAGCGSGEDKGADKSQESTTSSAQRSPTQVVQATNEKTTQAGSARVKMTSTVAAEGKSETVTGAGVMDFAQGTSQLTLGQAGKRLEQRVVDKTLYQKPPKGEGKLPGGKTWIQIDLKKLAASGAAGSDQASDPADSFAYSKSLSRKDIKKIGKENVAGADTTHYRVTLDIDKLAQGDAQKAKKLRQQLGESVPVDLWIDDKGLTRRQQMEMTVKAPKSGSSPAQSQGKLKTVMEFSDFGTDVNVSKPAASDTADMTDKLIQQGSQKA
ncbi:hypothetical protein G3I40_05280 [Streptomyces sp. SID14478]|uniref:hypothetical protein n=1 Tax=Streptomyces sp. SID14478 TaxID=2706073 RepID=UPI0013DCD814|nr:hypothetical protein [Streptomyces sp. SID14478]NEB74646.1 hypothetical protein [Streptomyces sp. SID14478]